MKKMSVISFGLILATLACERRGTSPILGEPIASSFRSVSTEALDALVGAREALDPAAPPESREALARAERSLQELTQYYVPLLDAQECAYRALRFYYLEPARVELELSRIESVLEAVARDRGPQVEAALADAETSLSEARTALSAGSGRAPEHLEALARQLSFMLIKGKLILK